MHEMIAVLLCALAPGRESTQQRRDHPYTTAGRQVDVAPAAAGWRSGSAAWPIPGCSPERAWPTAAAWRSAWAWTGC